MQIPTITIVDLKTYHEVHFPSQSLPDPLPKQADGSFSHVQLNKATESSETDDGLGYYPDGVKRTLTDEQIAIFRHSEIQRLLRIQYMREEQAEEQVVQTNKEFGYSVESPDLAHDLSLTDAEQQNNSKKRKNAGKNSNSRKKRSQPWTNRRRARELDEVRGAAAVNVELEY